MKVITASVIALAAVLHFAVGGIAGVAMLAILILSAAFAPRGYSIAAGELLVHRLGWATRFPIEPGATAEWLPDATIGSLRTFGNGGLFGFVGWFRNPIIGNYRAFATDRARTVVVRSGDTRLVVTPDDPPRFVAAFEQSASEQLAPPPPSH